MNSNRLSNVTVALPTGSGFGWGNCGTQLSKHLGEMGAIIADNLPADRFTKVKGTLLQAISGQDFNYTKPIIGDLQVGYGFIENDIQAAKYAPLAERNWDKIICGSTWMRDRMLEIFNVPGNPEKPSVVIQGVDTDIFHYKPMERNTDLFVVGSFGKFEYRKAQDVVIKAMSIFMQGKPDVRLLTAWHNPWPQIIGQMNAAGDAMVKVPYYGPGGDSFWRDLFFDQWPRIDASSLILRNAPQSYEQMAEYYQYCDVALFPNRCEAGTNLPMMEAGCCGLPCVTADATGHTDITRHKDYPSSGLLLTSGKPYVVKVGDEEVGNWVRPDLDEILYRLDYAYANREALRLDRPKIAEFGATWTWARSADSMANLLQ